MERYGKKGKGRGEKGKRRGVPQKSEVWLHHCSLDMFSQFFQLGFLYEGRYVFASDRLFNAGV